MINSILPKLVLSLLCVTIHLCSTEVAYDHDTTQAVELRKRDGLPNFFKKVEDGGEVRIAYLGGSITKAEGWRVKSFRWLQEQYPSAHFFQINAAVGGTGADFGACRVEDYVLAHHPDLVFVEYRVNSGGIHPNLAVEGIIRKIWSANPETDICFVYTIGIWMMDALSKGQQTEFGSGMESLANYYGIPSIDFGVEVIKRFKNGTLSFNVPDREEGKLWFTIDRCHPTDEGHDLYSTIISRSFNKLKQHRGVEKVRSLIPPLHENCYQTATYLPVYDARFEGFWEAVDIVNDPIYSDDHFRTNMMLDKALKTRQVGASFTVEWDGPFFAFTHIPQEHGIEVEVTVDGQAPVTIECDQTSSKRIYARYSYLPVQAPGKHSATIKVSKLPEGLTFYAGQFLVLKSTPNSP